MFRPTKHVLVSIFVRYYLHNVFQIFSQERTSKIVSVLWILPITTYSIVFGILFWISRNDLALLEANTTVSYITCIIFHKFMSK